jgi:hypothetical protein
MDEPEIDVLLAELDEELRRDAAARLCWCLTHLPPGDAATTDALIASALAHGLL